MGSAEDAIRRRRRAAEASRAETERNAIEAYEVRRDEFIQDALALVPAALQGLERAGWPGGLLVRVQQASFFRSRKELAAWPVGGYRFEIPDAGPSSPGLFNELYLLSDGRWAYGHDATPESLEAIVRRMGDGRGRSSLRMTELPEGVIDDLKALAAGQVRGEELPLRSQL